MFMRFWGVHLMDSCVAKNLPTEDPEFYIQSCVGSHCQGVLCPTILQFTHFRACYTLCVP